MKYTFNLKYPKSDKETLILFSCYFKNEAKKFVYSTGENIIPENWDFENRFPFLKGSKKAKSAESIKMQLNRYSDLFLETESLYKRINEPFTTVVLKKVFDEYFKKSVSKKNSFFDTYDEFTADKISRKEWADATIKRYQNIRNILKNFEKSRKFNLTFSKIDSNFHKEFTSYCMDDLEHINNTYSRNLGLFKTFMLWSLKNRYTYNDAFIEFKKVERVITNQIALTIEDLEKMMSYDFECEKLQNVRDVFVMACVTGMRFCELKLIKRSNVTDSYINLKEDKDKNKAARDIPLINITRYLLLKHDYNLPIVSNQKYNEYIKEVFQVLGYTDTVQKVTTRGKENIKEDMFFYERISTHTARRTFITMMRRQGKDIKLIASMTGHTHMPTLSSYYQISEPEKKEALDQVFNLNIPLNKIN